MTQIQLTVNMIMGNSALEEQLGTGREGREGEAAAKDQV